MFEALDSPTIKGSFQKGTVVANNDTQRLQRVRVRIANLHREIDDEGVPWSQPMGNAGPNGNTSTYGGLNIPEVGSTVWVFMPDEEGYDSYYISGGSSVANKIQELIAEDYPHCYGYLDRCGNLMLVNTTKNTWDFWMFHGTRITISPEGKVDFITAADLNVRAFGAVNLKADGTVAVDAPSINLNCGGNPNNLEKQIRERPTTPSGIENQTNW